MYNLTYPYKSYNFRIVVVVVIFIVKTGRLFLRSRYQGASISAIVYFSGFAEMRKICVVLLFSPTSLIPGKRGGRGEMNKNSRRARKALKIICTTNDHQDKRSFVIALNLAFICLRGVTLNLLSIIISPPEKDVSRFNIIRHEEVAEDVKKRSA